MLRTSLESLWAVGGVNMNGVRRFAIVCQRHMVLIPRLALALSVESRCCHDDRAGVGRVTRLDVSPGDDLGVRKVIDGLAFFSHPWVFWYLFQLLAGISLP